MTQPNCYLLLGVKKESVIGTHRKQLIPALWFTIQNINKSCVPLWLQFMV